MTIFKNKRRQALDHFKMVSFSKTVEKTDHGQQDFFLR